MPTLKSQARSHGGHQEKHSCSAPTETRGFLEQVCGGPSRSMESPMVLDSLVVRQMPKDKITFQCEIIVGRCVHTAKRDANSSFSVLQMENMRSTREGKKLAQGHTAS